MAKPQQGNTVKIHYTGRFLDGTEFDSSRGREPLAFEIGGGLVIPGFEKAVLDLEPGQSTNITIPPAEAYGEMREEMIAVVPSALVHWRRNHRGHYRSPRRAQVGS